MARKRILKDKLVVYILSALLVVMASFAVVNVLGSYFSLGDPDVVKWDGVSVSSSFSSGNGTKSNPYIIKSGEDLLYFKNLIEGLNSETYNQLYYQLGSDIDLGDNEFGSIGIVDGEIERVFKGNFDGNGYTIKNVKVTGNTLNNYEMYGLFSILDGGSVTNVNLENFDIYPVQNKVPLKVGVIASEVRASSSIWNVSIIKSDINLEGTSEDNASKIGGISGEILGETTVKNVYINLNLTSKYSSGLAKISHTISSSLSNIVVDVEAGSLMADVAWNYVVSNNDSIIDPLYEVTVNNGELVIKEGNNTIASDSLITNLDEGITGDFYWAEENGVLKLFRVLAEESIMPAVNFAFGNSVLVEHETGVVGDTAYLNDLESDYYNYIGQNYTWQNFSTSLPDGTNRGYYGTHNLVKTFIQYNGSDPSLVDTTGYVSLDEQVSNFNYYKYYVLDDGYITVELMDNPYADRPDDKAFGGWVSDYPGVKIWFDSEIHTYFAKIPVSDVSKTVNIIFHARWVPATVGTVTSASSSNYSNAFNELEDRGFKQFEGSYEVSEDITSLWYKTEVSYNGAIPRERYDENLEYHYDSRNSRCSQTTCVYYMRNGNSEYVNGRDYYEEVITNDTDRTLIKKDVSIVATFKDLVNGESAAGYYVQKTLSRGMSVVGYYDSNGNYMDSGTCNSTSCTYYELLQATDENGNPNIVDVYNNTYYWLINRDTNILFINTTATITTNFWNSSANDKPMTITGMHNGREVVATFNMSSANASVSAKDDLRIEYVRLYNASRPSDRTPSSSTSTYISGSIKGNYHNLKIGRGIIRNGSYLTAQAVIGGTNSSTGTSSNPTKYRLIIESGYYNNIGVVAGAIGSRTVYVDATAIYGSDFDRAIGEENIELMEVTQTAAGSWGGNVTSTKTGITTIVKYGSFGTDKDEYTYGIYVAALNGGTHSAVRTITVEGGYIYNLIGGPCVSSNRGNVNDIFINIKGGSIDFIVGGAGRTETYGHRLINVTGGVVNRAVYGGSNGYLGSNGEGVLTGSTLVYIGGNAVIGSDEALAGRPSDYGEVVGSVYGVGNGRSGNNYTNIGTASSSTIIIDQEAVINGHVFGGGNYGAVGTEINSSTKTDINILGGKVVGSIYGGGNNNGAGRSSTTFNVNIEMTGGEVGNIYGGSRTKGVIYGNTNINVIGGVVTNDVYGGGEGGYTNSTNSGTFVTGNVSVKIGRDLTTGLNELPLTINGSVYGGSAYGSVNGSSNSGSENTSLSTTVDVYYGKIHRAVFGGGKGDTSYTPKVYAPVTVNVNGGNIGSVYGGNDAAGQPASTDYVYLNGGIIGNAFGGGNSTGQDTTNIYLQGANVTNLFGGSNINGVVNETNVTMTAGVVTNVYGGNNEGTATASTNVSVSGGTINGDIYGGGMEAPVTSISKVVVEAVSINNVYGGGQKADAKTTVVSIKNVIGDKIFGGSNTAGTVESSQVTVDGNVNAENLVDVAVTRTGGWGNGSTTSVVYNVTLKNNTATVYNDWSLRLNLLSNYKAASYSISNHPYQSVTDGVVISNITAWNNSLAAYGSYSFDVTVNYDYAYDYNNPISFDTFVVDAKMVSPVGLKTSLSGVYGGNNAGGTTNNSNVIINGGEIEVVYGGGDLATTGESVVAINDGKVGDVFGGGNEAGLTTSDVNIHGGEITNVYGGSNKAGTVGSTDVEVGGALEQSVVVTPTITSFSGSSTRTTVQYNVSIRNTAAIKHDEWEIEFETPFDVASVTSSVYDIEFVNGKATVKNIDASGNRVPLNANSSMSFNFQVVYNEWYNSDDRDEYILDVNVVKPDPIADDSTIKVTNIYGGNNLGGTTGPTSILVNSGEISDIYGGGNKAISGTTKVVTKNANIINIYGGGKAASVNGDTFLDIDNCTLNTNVFGGGDEGEVTGKTEVFVTNSAIKGSLYAGGNGTTATVYGNTNVTVDGTTTIGTATSKTPYEGCVFGGGNKAFTGTEASGNSIAVVNIVGGHIYGNVYGGANTSVVYGGTVTNIGSNVVADKTLKQADIIIDGTVFGGGEANAEGSDKYDFDFFSVVGSINIYIDGTGYLSSGKKFDMAGSIFGSGNASSSSGTSNISIKKLGTQEKPSKNISIQRTNNLVIDNSYMELIGIEDSTNDFASIKYSFNRIDKLIIKNNTTLLLRKNANLLKEFYSGVDVNGELVPASVEIDDQTKKVTKNVDNRVYMIPYNNLNITTTQDATSYGKVTGMTFFGMYNASSDGSLSYGLYDYSIDYGDTTGAWDMIIGSSYVLGLHHTDHDIKVDGFYTNVFNEEMTEIITEYIEPSPPDSNFYRWMIGMQTINYTVDLTASKYSSLGTYSLTMLDFPDGDTAFEVMGFNSSGLNAGINLIDPSEVPRIAENEDIANTTFGLAMKSETREWTNAGVTEFTGDSGGRFSGETMYKTDSQKVAPSLMFYLYHPKNITKEGDIGSVLITLQSEEKINEIESTFNYVTITVNIVARNYNDGNSYDASITYDKKYEMPSATSVNITNRSQFTAYYSLYATGALKDIYGVDYDNYHVLTSTYAFPVGTQITMIDYGYDINNPQYYYFDVTEAVYADSLSQLENEGEIAYPISQFVRMGSTSSNNNYNDKTANKKYFDGKNTAMEEFVFIFDLKETNITGEQLEKSILFELRDSDDIELITVLGIRRDLMKFSLYDASNVILQESMKSASEYLYYNIDNKLDFQSVVGYDKTANGAAIIDTNYESSAMGLNMYVYDSSGNQVSSSLLTGTVLSIDGVSTFADGDGVFRTKLAGKVSNLSKSMNLRIDKMLPPGQYKLRFVLFASADGKHNSSLEKSAIVEIAVTVVGDDNAIKVTTDDKTKVVDGDTGLNQLKSRVNKYVLTYRSVLVNPNIRVDLYKRDVTDKDTTVYNEVDFNTLFTNELGTSAYGSDYLYEKSLNATVNSDNNYEFELQENLTSGTYKLVFRLYDGRQLIEEENEYIIVTKDVVKDS